MKEKGRGQRKRGGSFRVGRRNRYCSREGTRTNGVSSREKGWRRWSRKLDGPPEAEELKRVPRAQGMA